MKKKPCMDDFYALFILSKRNLMLFLKDKMSVFFSLLAPLIILMLYVLFLGDMQTRSLEGMFADYPFLTLPEKGVRAFVDSWMMAGVLAVSCITVAFSANVVMVADKNKGISADAMASPVKSWVVQVSYFVADFVVTVFITMLLYAVCLSYLGIAGEFHLSVGDVFENIGIILLSVLTSTALSILVGSFFRSEGALSGFIGILSAAIGFLIGAYMPISLFPKAVQSLVGFVPGSYSAGLFRNAMMNGALDYLTEIDRLPEEIVSKMRNEISQSYSMKLEFFGEQVGVIAMYVVLALCAVLFITLLFLPKDKLRIKLSALFKKKEKRL